MLEKRYALALDLPEPAECARPIVVEGKRLFVVAEVDDLEAGIALAELAFTQTLPPSLRPDRVCLVDRSSERVLWSRALP
jgi:hypothetical protein